MSGNNTGEGNGYWFGNRERGFQFYDDFSTTEKNDIYYQYDKVSENDILKQPFEVKKSYATLSFIISGAFVLPALTLLCRVIHKINNTQIKVYSHHLVYYTWLLVSCLFICLLNLLNLFDNFINSDNQSKSGKTCYYIYVIYGTLVSFVGLCLLSLAIDIALLVVSSKQHLVDVDRKKMRIHVTCFILSIVCFFINNSPHLTQHVNFRTINKCWKGNAYEGHVKLAAIIDFSLLGLIIIMTSVTLLLISILIKYQKRHGELMVIPAYMRVVDIDIETVIGDIQQIEEGLQERVSIETPSSDINAKIEGQAIGYKRYEPETNENELELSRGKGSVKRISRWKAEKESSSKDSSGHENTGYISEDTDHDGQGQRRQNLAFNSARRRFKSDSEIQEPRSQTYVMRQKSRKHSSRKVLEDQVFEALENFFVTDPSKLLFKALALQKQCELSAHLIDDSNDDKGTEEETSFSNKDLKIKEMKKKSRKLQLRKSKSLKSPSGFSDRLMRSQWSSLSCKEKSSMNKGQSDRFLDESCVNPETFSLEEKRIERTKSVENDMSKNKTLNKDLKVVSNKTECFNSPRIVVEDVDKDITDHSSETAEVTREYGDHLSVNVDVHCSDFSLSASSLDTVGTDIECHLKENTCTRSMSVDVPREQMNFGNWVEFMPDNSDSGALLKDKPLCKRNSASVDVEADPGASDVVNTDDVETDAVFIDAENTDPTEGHRSGDLESDKDCVETVESCVKSDTNGTTTSEIEIESSVEKVKEEIVPFKDYCKKYLLQPYKNVASFLLVYIIGLLPQIVLDLYRIVAGNQETLLDLTDGIMSICSDAALPFFLLAITILFLWQCRKKRNIKQDIISQQ